MDGLDALLPSSSSTSSWEDDSLTSTLAPSDYYEDGVNPCEIPFPPARRWYLVAVGGTMLSIISLLTNAILAHLLLKRKYSHFYFLGLLALSDTFLSFCYGPVIAMEIARFNVHPYLSQLWLVYYGPVLSLCFVAMTFSCFMIILGSIERYLITVKHKYLACFRRRRGVLAIFMFVLSVLLRGTAVFEFKVAKNNNCKGVMEFMPALTELVDIWVYGSLFRFYVRTIGTVLIPFFLLIFLNISIVINLRRQGRSASMFRFGSSEHKQKIRSATRLLLLIVSSYLIANSLNVAITAWEFLDPDSTTEESEAYIYYDILTDIISIFYVFTCATRMLVYISCNEEIRSALYEYLWIKREKISGHDYEPIQKINNSSLDIGPSMEPRVSLAAVGTEFDRVAIAMVLSQRNRDFEARQQCRPEEVPSVHVNTPPNSATENRSFIIANPLAQVSVPNSPREPERRPLMTTVDT